MIPTVTVGDTVAEGWGSRVDDRPPCEGVQGWDSSGVDDRLPLM